MIRIMLVDDHTLLRNGLYSLLKQESDMEVVAQASDGRTALQAAHEYKPDIVIMDINMPGLNGIEATRKIMAKLAGTKIIALSMYADKRFVLRMLEAGASGYLLKECVFEEIVRAIKIVFSSKMYLSPLVSSGVISELLSLRSKHTDSDTSPLTVKEREVIQLLSEGKTTKEIAASLHVSIKTTETHRQNIMRKLEINSIAGLTKYAVREGFTSL